MEAAIDAFFKYMTDMATAFYPMPERNVLMEPTTDIYEQYRGLGVTATGEPRQRGYSAMQRYHIILVVHDVMATLRGWIRDKTGAPEQLQIAALVNAVNAFKRHVPKLVEFAACRNLIAADNALVKLHHLIATWKKLGFLSDEETAQFRKTIEEAKEKDHMQLVKEYQQEYQQKVAESSAKHAQNSTANIATADTRGENGNDLPLFLPKRHGVKDIPDAAWHKLPAANGLFMKETRGYPLKAAAFPKGGYELENGGTATFTATSHGPITDCDTGKEASPELKKEVKHMYKEMLHCFDDFTVADSVADIDIMGNKIWKDAERDQRNYWGFTEEGLKKAAENKKKFRETAIGYADVPPLQREPLAAMNDINTAVARAQELAASRGFGDRGRGRGGWRGGRGGGDRGGRGGWRGGRGGRGGFY